MMIDCSMYPKYLLAYNLWQRVDQDKNVAYLGLRSILNLIRRSIIASSENSYHSRIDKRVWDMIFGEDLQKLWIKERFFYITNPFRVVNVIGIRGSNCIWIHAQTRIESNSGP